MKETDEFYIGWQTRAPVGIGSRARKTVGVLAVLLMALAGVLAWTQRTIGVAAFEWGHLKTFNGTLKVQPYPYLLVQRPGPGSGQSVYYLVAPFKFGLPHDTIAALDGKAVSLKGTLIYRGSQTMIEALPESIIETTRATAPLAQTNPNGMGRQTLVGEIVDSKCYMGVMNPGSLTPHRACAVRCISGGIPPIFLVRREIGPPDYFLLVSKDGHPVNKEVLDMIAEPVEITGEVVHQDGLSILRADPASYRRVGR